MMHKKKVCASALLAVLAVTACVATGVRVDPQVCAQTGDKVIVPLLRTFNAHIEGVHYDLAYVEAHVLKIAYEKYARSCGIALKRIEIDTSDCLVVQDTLYGYAQFLRPIDKVEDPVAFYSVLSAYTEECNPFKMRDHFTASSYGIKPAMACAACGVLTTVLDNYVALHKIDISEKVAQKVICKNITDASARTTCELVSEVIGQYVIDTGVKALNSDVLCNYLGACNGYEQCQLHPNDKREKTARLENPVDEEFVRRYLAKNKGLLSGAKPWDWILQLIHRFADYHTPLFDLDNDTFSDFPTLRGYDWRGYDCNATNPEVYPGRATPPPGYKAGDDYNCNGIHGIDEQVGKPWKEILCENTGQYGSVTIGDSAGAHFSVPAAWLNVELWQEGTFSDFIPRLSNELDLPHWSAGTGFVKNDYVRSGYLDALGINRCNRADYQNIAVNGARSGNEMGNMELALRRNQTTDFPIFINFELIGNDVCNGHPGMSHMTTPEQFRVNILKLWNFIDTRAPKGSHMVVTGVADGTVLYNTLKDKLTPLGVPYPVFYDFLNCLEISPCWGWMNSNEEARLNTTARAVELNEVYKQIIANTTFQNFDILYQDVPMDQVFARAEAMGFTRQDCIEPVDGFHPSQLTNYLIAQITLERVQREKPDWLSKKNENNDKIEVLFPDIPWP